MLLLNENGPLKYWYLPCLLIRILMINDRKIFIIFHMSEVLFLFLPRAFDITHFSLQNRNELRVIHTDEWIIYETNYE